VDPKERREYLLSFLNDPDPSVQEEASKALEKLDAYLSLPHFLNELKQNDTPRQLSAVYGLAKVQSSQVFRVLLQLLRFPKLDLAMAALRVLVDRGDVRFIKPLLDLYPSLPPPIKEGVLEMVGSFRDPRIVEVLQKEIPGYTGTLLSKALITLGKVGDPRSLPLIKEYLSHPDPLVRRSAIYALGEIFVD
jgi:HEAT repeat protein